MKTTTVGEFYIIGIAIRTSNENGQSATDIPLLWNRFLSEQIMAKIPNKISGDIYCVYTDYEKDHTRPYTTVVGCKVELLEEIPEGLTGLTINEGNYIPFTATGNIAEGIVFKEWTNIWNLNLPRAYTADFEVYGEKTQNPGQAEVDIFIAVN
jgi:predicted transcriptional regulator YdeE